MPEKQHPVLMLHSSSDLYGSGRIFWKSVIIMQRMGYKPVVVLSTEGPLSDELQKKNVEIHFINLGILRRKYQNIPGIFNRIFSMIKAYHRLKRLVRDKRIQFVYSQSSGILIGGILARLLRLRHIWHVLEITERPRWYVIANAFFMRFCSNVVMVASDAVKHHWGKYIPVEKIQTVYNGIDISVYEEGPSDEPLVNLKETFGSQTIVIGMIARVHFWKGQGYFLDIAAEVLKKHKNVKFLMAGDAFPGYEYLYDELSNKKKVLSLEDYVIDVGYVSKPLSFIRSLDIFILPSTQPDPFPTTVLEAMALRKPVVATSHGGATEMVVEDDTGYLIPWDDAEKAARKICMLVESEERRAIFGKNGYLRVNQKFTDQNYEIGLAKLMKQHYNVVLGEDIL